MPLDFKFKLDISLAKDVLSFFCFLCSYSANIQEANMSGWYCIEKGEKGI